MTAVAHHRVCAIPICPAGNPDPACSSVLSSTLIRPTARRTGPSLPGQVGLEMRKSMSTRSGLALAGVSVLLAPVAMAVASAAATRPLDNVVGVATVEMLEKKGDFIRAVIRARRKAVQFMKARPDEAAEIVAKQYNIDLEVAKSAVRNLTSSTTNGAHNLAVTAGSGTATFGDAIGNTTPLTDLDISAGTINLGGNVSTAGSGSSGK